ncbi:MAG: hypothetical protein AB7O62_04250 [Pirellulales bacterium]
MPCLSIDRRLLLALLAVCLSSPALAAAPAVRNVNLRGLQIGGTTKLVFDGLDLLPEPKVMLPVPVTSQTVMPGATANRVEIEIVLPADIVPGLYGMYLAHAGGISERTVVAADHLPQRPFADKAESLPMALHGTLNGSTTLKTTFAGTASQPLMCEVESQRLGGKVRPVLHLYDPAGKHLAWSLPQQSLRGDTRLSATLPADGEYTLTLHDLQFGPPGPNFFRLKLGQWQYADAVFPPAIPRGATAALSLVGNAAAGRPVTLVPAGDGSSVPAPWLNAVAASGPAPSVIVSDLPEVVEQPLGAVPQDLPAFPVAVSGRIMAEGEIDQYRLRVARGDKLRLEIFAARLDSPLDSVLELRRDNGAVLAANDDIPQTADSALDFEVPADVDALTVVVKDALGRGEPDCVYRLLITQPAVEPSRGDFQLFVEQDRYNVPQDGRLVVQMRVQRQGYTGPILLDFGSLPAGVTADSHEIPAGADGKLVTFSGAAEGLGQAQIKVRGMAMADPRQPLVRVARREGDAVDAFQPWLAEQMLVSLASRDGIAFSADWQPAADTKFVLGKKLAVPVTCVRPVGFDGPVRLTMLTSQNPPRVNSLIDVNRTLRHEANAPTVEIPSDGAAVAAWDAKLAADKVLADAQTAQAAADKAVADAQTAGGPVLEAATKAKADADLRVTDATSKVAAALETATMAATNAKNDLSYGMFVPAEFASAQVQVAWRAELLSRDRQRVLLTVCTPAHALSVVNPIHLTLAGPAELSARLDPAAGATFKLAGKVERLEGITGDIAVTLQGLPPGIAVPRAALNAMQTDYELTVTFPANFAPAPLANVQLFATGRYDAAQPLETRSEAITLHLELLPPEAVADK